jgi:hypothetical protein
MDDTLKNISVATIPQEIDTAYLRSLNFPFVQQVDSFPYNWLKINEISPVNKDSITERFLTITSQKPAVINPQLIKNQQSDWLVGILIFCFFVISYIRITRKKYVKDMLLGLYSRPMFRQMIREGALYSSGLVFPMTLVVLLTYSVFTYQIINLINPDVLANTVQIQLLSYLFGGILVLLLTKTLLVRGAGFLFKTSELAEEYASNSYYFHIITAVSLLPFLFFSIFDKSSILIYLSLFVTALLFIYRILRGVLISLEMQKYSPYQNLLYLCTLEFLPILVIIKAII